MADRTEPTDIPVDANVVRRIGENQIGLLCSEKARHMLRHHGVATQQSVATQEPKVAGSGYGNARQRGNAIGRAVWRRCRSLASLIEREVNLRQRETRQRHIEFQVDERLQFDRENFRIPAGIQRKLVVGEHIGAPFLCAQVRKPDGRNGCQSQFLGRHQPSMAGDDLVMVADENRIRKAEPRDAVGDLAHLLLRVPTSVAGIGS